VIRTNRAWRLALKLRRVVARGFREEPMPTEILPAFSRIFEEHYWFDRESRSGPGSSVTQTTNIREQIPRLLASLGIGSILDVPCGDFNWMRYVDLGTMRYIGADVVPEIIANNRIQFADPQRQFLSMNAADDALPQVDLVLCRDLLVHLSFSDATRALANFRRSGSTYLLVTTFPAVDFNKQIETGAWRPLNLQLPPFSLPEPITIINEGCTEDEGKYADKSLALWRLADLAL
jgi:hypothetical protein